MRTGSIMWNALKAVGGFVVGSVTVFGWLNVTPDMVGQAAYDAFRGPAPLVVMFAGGFLTGWGLTRLRSDGRQKRADDAHAIEVDELRDEQRSAIAERDARIAELEKRPAEQTHSMDGTINANLTAVRSVSPLMAQAMLDARNAPSGECEVSGKTGDAVDESCKRKDGVFFIRPCLTHIPDPPRYYVLNRKWVEYLKDETVLKELAKRAKEPY